MLPRCTLLDQVVREHFEFFGQFFEGGFQFSLQDLSKIVTGLCHK